MQKVDIVQVDMSEIQAERFVQFQKYYQLFETFLDAGLFELKNGSATLHYDHMGNLQEIDFNQVKFKRK